MRPRVIVTRPAREAARWVDDLRAAGFDAHALPLIAIEPVEPAGRAALQDARRRIGDYAALMFVSAAAVEHFEVPSSAALAGLPRLWGTGPGTVRALRGAGVPDARIDAPPGDAPSFDSEALWDVVRPQVGAATRVLIVRGGDARGRPAGRDWLAREIEGAGGVVDTVVAYRRRAPVLDAGARALAAAAAVDGTVWLFSSSEAVANLRRAMPEIDWRAACAVATHARIAEAARAAGFGTVRLASAGLAALTASIESFA
jgi:uroporphyrinogen-III synthase